MSVITTNHYHLIKMYYISWILSPAERRKKQGNNQVLSLYSVRFDGDIPLFLKAHRTFPCWKTKKRIKNWASWMFSINWTAKVEKKNLDWTQLFDICHTFFTFRWFHSGVIRNNFETYSLTLVPYKIFAFAPVRFTATVIFITFR